MCHSAGITHDIYVTLARQAIDDYVRRGASHAPSGELPEEMASPAATFVSIKVGGRLRGCIGTLSPTRSSVAEEIVANAIKSASEDPRFPPIALSELDSLEISVDVLGTPQRCNIDELDPHLYGVIVESGGRRGVLLPDLAGVDTVDAQVSIAREKAGIAPHTPVTLYRFPVRRHT